MILEFIILPFSYSLLSFLASKYFNIKNDNGSFRLIRLSQKKISLTSEKCHINRVKTPNYMTFHNTKSKLPSWQNKPDSTRSPPTFNLYPKLPGTKFHVTKLESHHLPHFQAHVMFFRPAVGVGISVKADNLKAMFFIK